MASPCCRLLYHYQTRPIVPGGLFGVDLFFVLSGFLITSLLVQEWQNRGGIDLPAFYRRRCLRLLPAAVVFVAAYTAIVVLLSGPVLTWLGRRSYATYLWHFPMGLLFASLTMEGQLLVAGGMTLAIAEVSHRLIEAPALRWRRAGRPATRTPQPGGEAGAAVSAA